MTNIQYRDSNPEPTARPKVTKPTDPTPLNIPISPLTKQLYALAVSTLSRSPLQLPPSSLSLSTPLFLSLTSYPIIQFLVFIYFIDFFEPPFMDDFLDDLPSNMKAPPRNKFQPKARARPKKGSVSVPSVSAPASHVQPAKSVPVASESNQLGQPNDVDGNSLAEAKQTLGSTVTTHPESSISKFTGDEHFQNADTSLGVKSVEDTIGQTAIADASPAVIPTVDASTTHIEEDMSAFPDVSFASTVALKSCSAVTAQAHSMSNIDLDTGHYKETDYFSLEEADIASGKRAVKFQPKPKAQSSGRKDSDHVPHAAKGPSEDQDMNNDGPIGTVDGVYYVDTTTFQPEDIDSSAAPRLLEESGEHGNKIMSDAFNFSYDSLDKELPSSGIEVDENGNVYLDGEDDGIQYHNSSYAEAVINRDESIEDDRLMDEASKKKRRQKQKEIVPENDKPTRKRRKASKASDESSEKPPKKFSHTTRRKRTVNKALLEAPEDEIDLHRVPIRDLIILAEYKERQAKKDSATGQSPSTDARNDNSLHADDPYDNDGTFGSDQDDDSLDNPAIERILTDARYFNYQSHMKRTRVRWSKQDTELFYQGIRQFGSDLSMIEQLFPGRDRKQIKLKFKNEERQHPQRLNDALSRRANDHSQFEFVIKNLQERAAKKKAERNEMSSEDDLGDQRGEDEGPDEGSPENDEMAARSEQHEYPSAADQEPDEYQTNPESEPEPEPEPEPEADNSQVASPAKSNASEDDFDWSTYQSEI